MPNASVTSRQTRAGTPPRVSARPASLSPRRGTPQPAFTLIELLVVVVILVILIGILLPALRSARQSVQAFQCKTHLREVVFAFRLFADNYSKGSRGDSDLRTDGRFMIEDFQENMYRISEFWDAPGVSNVELEPQRELMLCPAGRSGLRKVANLPCSDGAVLPKPAVSIAFNMRLHKGSLLVAGNYVPVPVALSEAVLSERLGNLPLVFDIDGVAGAAAPPPAPYYSAPPLPSPDFYSSGTYWFPSTRHRGQMNAGFVDGHVDATSRPLDNAWAWHYTPPL
jgi:prepilin-type N-terminal cleavage/methylation domain-containing protein/prepilin-type processing-associated H-X9-DG protein